MISMHKTFILSFIFLASTFLSARTSKINTSQKLPIIYHENYNGSFGKVLDWMGSLVHPFDKQKFKKIYSYLVNDIGIRPNQFYTPQKVSEKDLLLVHDAQYLKSLHSPLTISRAIDLQEMVALIPSSWLYEGIVVPQKYATHGTILGAQLAMEHGWAINLAGGYHHAKRALGEGGCLLGDIPLAVIKLREKLQRPDLKVLIVDLDAHQGNGLEDYFKDDEHTVIFDMYNKNEYPKNADDTAQYIDFSHPLDGGSLVYKLGSLDLSSVDHFCFFEECENRRVSSEEYLNELKEGLPAALETLKEQDKFPDLIIFNAGTDPFEEDDWGCMDVSFEAIIARDQFVWQTAANHKIPILMVLSGGYSSKSAQLIAQSIEQILIDRKIIA